MRIRNPDAWAERLLPDEFWTFGLFTRDHARTRDYIRSQRIGDYYWTNAMTRHIDGILRDSATRGVRQVVLLRAGLDGRPYRFAEELPDVRFFEMDRAAALESKKGVVREALGSLPDQVRYVPSEDRFERFLAPLLRAGFEPGRRTLFVWEGTSMLTAGAVVDETLREIARRAAAGSELVFDYVLESVLEGDFRRYPAARYDTVLWSAKGEPWKFGIAEGETAAFARRRGFDVLSDLGPRELADRYLVRSDGTLDGTPTRYWRAAHLVVRAE